jgi:uncharacterized protein
MPALDRLLSLLLAVSTLAIGSSALAGAYEDILVAARDDRTETVVDLVRRGMDTNTSDRSGTTLLMLAAGNGNEALIEFLLTNGANTLKQNNYGDTAVGIAALRGRLNVVRRLVEAGAAIHSQGWTPLHYAAFTGQKEVAKYLISRQAPLDALAPNGQTALMVAARNGHLDVVKLLVDADADMDLDDPEGNTALGLAIKAGNSDIADYLRSEGAEE